MRTNLVTLLVLGPFLVAALWLAEPWQPPELNTMDGSSYAFGWDEGSNFTVVEFWNAESRADCAYASNPWPQAELAAQRAYVLGARQVLRDEWDISAWIAGNRSSSSTARIHGAETNCPDGHIDFPPHVHIFYVSEDADGIWRHINSHQYPNDEGRIDEAFVIPNLCGLNNSYDPDPDQWVDILDETCTAIWQQRFTWGGDIELRRSESDPTYVLRSTGISGDLSQLDVLLDNEVLYRIQVTEYDPIALRMAAVITDHRRGLLTTETWWGDPNTGSTLAGHTTETLGETPAPTSSPAFTSTPTATSTPTSTASPSPTPTPTLTLTPAVTHTDTPAPTATDIVSPTATVTLTLTITPTLTATVTATPNFPQATETPGAIPTDMTPPAPAEVRHSVYVPALLRQEIHFGHYPTPDPPEETP